MALTPKYSFPVPGPTDQADGPNQMLALANAIEALLNGTGVLDLLPGTGSVKVKAPVIADNPATKGYVDGRLQIGPVASAPATAADGTIYFGY